MQIEIKKAEVCRTQGFLSFCILLSGIGFCCLIRLVNIYGMVTTSIGGLNAFLSLPYAGFGYLVACQVIFAGFVILGLVLLLYGRSKLCAIALIISSLSIATNLTLLKAPLRRLHVTSIHETEYRIRQYSERSYHGSYYEQYLNRSYRETVELWNELYDDDYVGLNPVEIVNPTWQEIHSVLSDADWTPVSSGKPLFLKSRYGPWFDDVLVKTEVNQEELKQWMTGLELKSFSESHQSNFWGYAGSPHWKVSPDLTTFSEGISWLVSKSDTNRPWSVYSYHQIKSTGDDTLFMMFSQRYPYGRGFNPTEERRFIQNVQAVYRKRHTKGVMKGIFRQLGKSNEGEPVALEFDDKFGIPLIGYRSTEAVYHPASDATKEYLYIENEDKNWVIKVLNPNDDLPKSVSDMEPITDYVFWKKHH